MRTLARGLPAQDLSCEAWLPEPLQDPHVVEWFAQSGVPTHSGTAFMAGWPGLLRAASFYRATGASTINVHYPWLTPSLSMVVAMRLAGAKNIVLSPHGAHSQGIRRTTAIAYNLARRTVVTTSYQRRLLESIGVRPEKITEVPLGVPPSPRVRSPLVPKDESGRVVIGTLCRFVPLKRVDVLLRACARIPDFSRRFRLLIGGSGPEGDRLQALAAEHPEIEAEFIGHVNEPWRFYQSLDLFVLVSELESFGLVYIEAAQQGVPSVGCRNGGVPCAIIENETGYLVDPEHPEIPLRDLLDKLDSAVLPVLGASARRHGARFTEASYATGYANIFKA